MDIKRNDWNARDKRIVADGPQVTYTQAEIESALLSGLVVGTIIGVVLTLIVELIFGVIKVSL